MNRLDYDRLENAYVNSLFSKCKVKTLPFFLTQEEKVAAQKEFPLMEFIDNAEKTHTTVVLAPRKGYFKTAKALHSFIWVYLQDELPVDLSDNLKVERCMKGVTESSEPTVKVSFLSKTYNQPTAEVLSKHKIVLYISGKTEQDIYVDVVHDVLHMPKIVTVQKLNLEKALKIVVDYFHENLATLKGLIEK